MKSMFLWLISPQPLQGPSVINKRIPIEPLDTVLFEFMQAWDPKIQIKIKIRKKGPKMLDLGIPKI